MKIVKYIIIVLITLIISIVIIFLSKQPIIRHDFISKLLMIDYSNYILTFSVNNKKHSIYYCTENCVAMRNYDDSEELSKKIIIYDYNKCLEYEYDIDTKAVSAIPLTSTRDTHVNNQNTLSLLQNGNIYNKNSFKYKGIQNINNRECYVLHFTNKNDITTTVYLDQEFFYTVKIDHYIPSLEKDFENATIDNHITLAYDLDFDLNQKDLFSAIDINKW